MAIGVYTPDANRIIHHASVDFANRSSIPCCVHLMQYDKSLPIVSVGLFLKGQVYVLPSGASVNIRVGKPDGTKVYNAVSGCNTARNTVYFEITRQIAAAYGSALVSIELIIDDKIAGSSYIALAIDKNPAQEDAIESSDEYKILNDVIAEAEAVISNPPKIQNGTWWIWDSDKKAYVDSGYSAGSGSVTSETEVFICTISGSSCDKTLVEINAAFAGGKLVYAKDNTRLYPMTAINSQLMAQFCVALNGIIVGYTVTGSGTVTSFKTTLENQSNRESSISASSTDTKYPTSKAVWNAIPHPVTKTDAMTQDVGVDAEGKLYTKPGSSGLPTVTASDNGKFLRVVSGAWAAATIADANGVSF